ncbi:MAG: hypothetical protein ABL931_21340 [Usitatibacteraceae bacterium]
MKMSFDVKRLDAVLSNCEDALLLASDEEVLVGGDAEIGETAAFIQARLAQYRDAAGRRRLLGRLIASRPELPARISMAFKSREPRDEEVAEMLNELLRSSAEDREE